MVDASREVDLGRLEGVVCGEVDGEEKDTARIWGIALLNGSVSHTLLSVHSASRHPVPPRHLLLFVSSSATSGEAGTCGTGSEV